MNAIAIASESTQEHAAASSRRRAFLGGIAALGASALVPGCASVESGAAARRIDVHHHIAPPWKTRLIMVRVVSTGPSIALIDIHGMTFAQHAGVAGCV